MILYCHLVMRYSNDIVLSFSDENILAGDFSVRPMIGSIHPASLGLISLALSSFKHAN